MYFVIYSNTTVTGSAPRQPGRRLTRRARTRGDAMNSRSPWRAPDGEEVRSLVLRITGALIVAGLLALLAI